MRYEIWVINGTILNAIILFASLCDELRTLHVSIFSFY